MDSHQKHFPGVHALRAALLIILALASCLPAIGFGAREQSFKGKVVEVECAAFGIVVRILVTSREGVTEHEARMQRRPDIEEVRFGMNCPVKESSVRKFILKKTRKKIVTVRFDAVDRGNRPMADVLLPGGQSLMALVEARFPRRKNAVGK